MSERKPARRRGQIISVQVPHKLLSELDAMARHFGWDRSRTLNHAISTLHTVKENIHVEIKTEPTPREAADLLAGRGRVRIPLRIATGLAVEQAAGDHLGGQNFGEADGRAKAV